MKLRFSIAIALLVFVLLNVFQTAEAHDQRLRHWIANDPDGCARIYVYLNGSWSWPYLALNSGGGDEAPLDPVDVQPKYVCPRRNVHYKMTARFSDGYPEIHEFDYIYGGISTPGGGTSSGGSTGPTGGLPGPNFNPGAGNGYTGFYAYPPVVAPGQCSLLRWDFDNVSQIYFLGLGVTGHEGRCVYPLTTTSYYLRVINYNGTEFYPSLTVFVATNPIPSCQPWPQCNQPPPCQPWPQCNQPIISGPIVNDSDLSEALMNLNSYCDSRYGGANASFTSRTDAYTWGCYRNGQYLGSIDMNEVCRTQHPLLPKAVMTDRGNVYSWVCRR